MISFSGVHTGAPLQELINPLNKDVGEEGGLLTSSKSLCPPSGQIRRQFFKVINPKNGFCSATIAWFLEKEVKTKSLKKESS